MHPTFWLRSTRTKIAYTALSECRKPRAIARTRTVDLDIASETLEMFLQEMNFGLVPIGVSESRLALHAHRRYGKETGHPARLNMGDCFAYACAKANDASVLYKGNDFALTDLA